MNNKLFFYLKFVPFILFFIGCSTKNENSFIISGKISNLTTNYIILSLVEDLQTNKTIVIDTLKVNKRGKFNAVYFLEPAIYNLIINDTKTVQLAIDKGQNIDISGENVDNLNINGSLDTKLLTAYETFRKESLDRLVNFVRDSIKKLKTTTIEEIEIADLRELEVENYKRHLNELVQFVKEKMGTSIAVYATSPRWNSENLPFLKELVTRFENVHPKIEITQKLKNQIQLLEKTAVGSPITGIKMPNQFGEIVELDSIKGTYTLVDFWASWCPPCRIESVLLNNLYKEFNSKGFEIYGISLDSNKERWLKALEMDHRIWTNVSTLEGFKTPISIEYGISALPTNFIIDSKGKIIASNIHGKALKEKIKELFIN